MKAMTNTIINSMMSNVVKYICAVVLLFGLSVNVWGGITFSPSSVSVEVSEDDAWGELLEGTDNLTTITIIGSDLYAYGTPCWSISGTTGGFGSDHEKDTWDMWCNVYCESFGTTDFTTTVTIGFYAWFKGTYEATLTVSYQDAGGTYHEANLSFTVDVVENLTKYDVTFNEGTGNTLVVGSSGVNGSTKKITTASMSTLPTATPCDAASSAGWMFDGWKAGGTVSNGSTSYTKVTTPYAPTAATTLYAVYKKKDEELSSVTEYTLQSGLSDLSTSYWMLSCSNNASTFMSDNQHRASSSSPYVILPESGTYNNSKMTSDAANAVWLITEVATGVYTFYNVHAEKYLAATSTDKELILTTTLNDYAKWSLNGDGDYRYVLNRGRSNAYLQYSSSAGSWRCSENDSPTTEPYRVRFWKQTKASIDAKMGIVYQSAMTCSNIYRVYYEQGCDDAEIASGSIPTDDNEYEEGESVDVAANTLARVGYTFANWLNSYNGNTYAGDGTASFYMGDADITLTAQWTANTTAIILNQNGGSANGSASVTFDATSLTSISDATAATGYHLEGYYTDDATPVQVLTSEGEFAAPNITGYVTNGKWSNTNDEITLYAHWELNTHSIHWYKNDESADDLTGSYTDGDDVAYGTTITAPNTPTFTGHTFTGWSETSSGSTVTPVTSMPDADKTYYAIWSLNSHTLTISSVDNVTISATTPSVAEGSNTSVEYGSTVTLSKNSLTSGYYWGGWKVYNTDDTNTTVAVSNNQFTMPDYDVTVSAIIYPKAKLLTRCQNTVTYHYAGGTTSERVATDAHPTGYTPADCENKRFMGWTTPDIGSDLTQIAPSMTDPTAVTVDDDLDFYAVYASPNGGKVTGSAEHHRDSVNTLSGTHGWSPEVRVLSGGYMTYILADNATASTMTKVAGGELVGIIKLDASQEDAHFTTFTKVRDLEKISFSYRTTGHAIPYYIKVSKDGHSWTTIKSETLASATDKVSAKVASISEIDDYYVQIGTTYHGTGTRYAGIMGITYTTKSRSVWYSDYSNGCDVAGAATLTYKDNDGTTTIGTHAATPSVPEVYTVEEQAKAGYTFDYITVVGQTYAAGDKYLLAHDVDAVITWKENPTISGNVYATAGYTNSTAQPVQSSMTVTATTTENKTGTLTIDNATGNEGGTFEAIITNGTVNNASLNATIAIKYTPTQAGVEETATMTATIDGASTNFTVHGRSLPAEFVIAAKQGNNWYALPADMSEAQNPSGKTIQVDNVSDPTVALIAQPLCRYQLYAGNNAGNIDVTKVRFNPIVTETNRNALWGSESNSAYTIRNWAAIGSGNDAHYQWSMSTTDNETYVLHLNAANGGAGRDLEISQSGSNIGKWGLYGTSSSAVIRFLPVTEEYAEAEFSVVEWYPTKVMIETNQTPTDIQSSINGGEFTAKVSPVGDGNKYVINTGTLTACYAQPLTIKYVTDAETVAKTMDIPIIISGNASASVEALVSGMSDGAYYKYTDLVVRDNSVLTIDGSNQAKNTFRNVWIMPSGKIIVPDTKRLTASSLNLFGGIDDIYNGSTYTTEKYGVPEFSLKGTLYRNSDNSLTAATYYMRTDGNQYYLLAAPSTTTINASDIKRGNTETGLTLNYDLGLLKYDGARRSRGVAGSDNWIDANTLERGLGYWIAADPIDGETYSLLRMPMTIAESDQTVAVIAHAENPSAAAVHKGWNFIANPFMTSVQTGALTFEGGTTATNFVVTPDEENYTQSFYDTHLLVADYQLKPFKGYFVQVGTSGNLSFGASTRQAPARMAAQDTINEVLYTVTIAGGESKSGTMGFFIAPNYTDQYDIGFDFEWMPSAGQDAYALYNNTRLRYTALPAYLAKLAIPVAYTAREAGTYTWTLNAYTNGQDLEHVYLIDYELDVTHDLLTGPYEFTTAVQTENQTRFAIATEVGEHRAPTDVETVEEDSGGGGPIKFIYHDKMYILNDNVIYDATGKRVKVVANGQKGGAL